MNTLLIQIRVALTTLLLCLSSVSSAIQIHLDEQNDECADIESQVSAQYHTPEAEDQDNEPCFTQIISNDTPQLNQTELGVEHRLQISEESLQPIRAPPSNR